jgi:PAS domain S-box-containing protein
MISASGALSGSYAYGHVARSVLIAILASYAALDLAGRGRTASGRVRLAWLAGGATAMGLGIWAMHFKGMVAFRPPVPVQYHWPTVLAALLVAILASAAALYVACRQERDLVAILTGSILMGAGIAGMHYIGMAAMRLPAVIRYSALLVTCSIAVAILLSLLAFLLAFGVPEKPGWSVVRRLGSATVMGAAVCAMHYTGMAAASFFPAPPPDLSHAVDLTNLANSGVVIAALIMLLSVLTTSSADHRQREDRLRLVIDTLPALVSSKLPDGSVDFLNLRFRDYTGLSVDEGLGRGWMMKVFHPEDRSDEEWRAAFSAGEPFEKEVRLKRADGVYRWFLLRVTPLRDEHGRVVKWYGTGTDIEDRKRAGYELRRQKEVFQKIFDNIPVMVAFFGADGRVELVNAEWERTTGWTLKEIREQSLDIFAELFPDPRYCQMARDSVVAPAVEWTDFKVRVRDGRVIDMAAYAVRLSDGSILGIGRDITERKRAEAELRESEARFRLVADSAPVMIWMSNTDKLCTYFNQPWLDFNRNWATAGWTGSIPTI